MRLPRKPLRLLSGLPLIVRVWQRISQMNIADAVVVATDDESVASVVRQAGAECVMTSDKHTSGTERVAEVAAMPRFQGYTTIVNVQGDEPFIGPGAVRGAAELVSSGTFPLGTAASLASREILDTPSLVKVVVADDGRAMYFSRAPIAWWRDGFAQGITQLPSHPAPLRHVGLYAYRAGFLRRFPTLAVAPLELQESLEQLRVLWHGERIAVHVSAERPGPGVDTPEDLARVRALFQAMPPGN